MFPLIEIPSRLLFKLKQYFQPSGYFPPHNLPEIINVDWEYDKENESYFAEVTSLPGLYTTSKTAEKIIRNVNSIMYRHFETPDHIAQIEMNKILRYNPPFEAIEKLKEQGGSIRTKLLLAKTQ